MPRCHSRSVDSRLWCKNGHREGHRREHIDLTLLDQVGLLERLSSRFDSFRLPLGPAQESRDQSPNSLPGVQSRLERVQRGDPGLMQQGNGDEHHIRRLNSHLAEGHIRAGIHDDGFL